jgi:hypothetical protein
MSKIRALIGSLIVIGICVGLVQMRSGDDSSEASGIRALADHSGAIASSPTSEGLPVAPLTPETMSKRGTFRSHRGYSTDVYEGDVAPEWNPRSKLSGPLAQGKAPRGCVLARGGGFGALTCRVRPIFGQSNVLFLESASGGPSPRERAEYAIVGIASLRVTRVEAITSNGNMLQAEISSNHAFFLELSQEQLSRGATVTHLRIYGPGKSPIEQIAL